MNLFDSILGQSPVNKFLSGMTPEKKVMSYDKPGYNPYANSDKAPTNSFLYKSLAPYEQTASDVTGAMQDTSKMYQGISQDITQGAQDIANTPGLEALGRSWKNKYPDTAKFDDATVGKAVLAKYPEYNSYVQSKTTAIGAGAKILGGVLSMFASAPGQVAGGTEQLGTGLGTIASAQSGQDVAEGTLQALKGGIQAGFGVATGAMPIASTIFGAVGGTDTGGDALNKLSEYSGIAGQKTAQLLGGNQQVQDQAKGLGEIAGPALALKGVSMAGKPLIKGADYIAPKIVKGVEVIAPKVVELAGKIPNLIPTKKGIQRVSNSAAEQILASQWKLDKKTRDVMQQNIGENGAKFALERGIVGKNIENTADNAGLYKVKKIQEKMDAVKTFGNTKTPDVAINVANVLKNDIIDSVSKSYGKDADIMKVLEQNHPELASVFKLTNEVVSSKKIDYLKLEQLKELHDYLNPEGIQYDISGKPLSETKNILSAGKRSKLQQILEDAGNKNGVDIKGANKDIQGAYQLEKGLNNSISRIQNLNILGLGDTQVAMISAILGGAPGAIGAVLLKKGLQSEGFRAGLAKKLFTKTPKDVTTNTLNPSGTVTPTITRMGRIMSHSNNIAPPKVTPKTKKTPSTTPKPKESVVVPKKTKDTPIVKKSGVEPKVDANKELGILSEKAKNYKTWDEFYEKEIKKYDGYAPEFRNPIMDNWRNTTLKDLQEGATKKGVIFSTNSTLMESSLNSNKTLLGKYTEKQLQNMSVESKMKELLGNDYVELYKTEAFKNPYDRIKDFFNQSKSITPKPTPIVKKTIIKPNSSTNEQQVSKPKSNSTTTNMFGETIPKPLLHKPKK